MQSGLGRGFVKRTSEPLAPLVSSYQAGNKDALERLLLELRRDLWAFLLNHGLARADAEDLFQEICMKISRKIKTLKKPEACRSWVFAIALNSVRSFCRRRVVVSVPWEDEPMQSSQHCAVGRAPLNPEQSLQRSERMKALRTAIGRLSSRDREVLLLDTMAEMPQKEIAQLLGLNLNTVKTVIRRSKIRVARYMVEAQHG